MRTPFALVASSLVLLSPALVQAQEDPNCPPGGWFCEETEPPVAEPDDEPEAQPPGDREPGERKRPSRRRRPPNLHYGHPPVVVYEAPPAPPPKKRTWRRKWGINLHLEGVVLGGGDKRADDAGMAGVGLGFRYRPVPHFAFEAGLDFAGGVDWQGNQRSENALLFNGYVYFNPRDAVQFYLLGGIGFSGATVTPRDENGQAIQERRKNYSYFGGQLGAGLEFRVTRRVSLNLDMVGFMRGRTDEEARLQPEFTDPDTGRTTNTSGGGLFRGGITFYW